SWTRKASSMKCDACARLRHRIKRAGAKPKPTPNAAAPSFGSIQTANGSLANIDFENAAVSRVFRFMSRQPLGFAFADDSKTKIVAGEIRDVGAASGRAQTGEARFPTAAAINAFGSTRGSVRIGFGRRLVLLKEIAAPFPDIPRHILHPERTGSAWK